MKLKLNYNEIFNNLSHDTRASLIKLREALADGSATVDSLKRYLGYNYSTLLGLLKEDDDPKIRRLAARILGVLEDNSLATPLYEAYINEDTNFIKKDLLLALKNYDYLDYIDDLKKRAKLLEDKILSGALENDDNLPHSLDELESLHELILFYREDWHEFTAVDKPLDIVLIQGCQPIITAQQIHEGGVKFITGGIKIYDGILKELLQIRTYSKLYLPFSLDTIPDVDKEPHPSQLALALIKGELLELLKNTHDDFDNAPFTFRIDLGKGYSNNYIKELVHEIERLSEFKLLNSTSDYEISIKLIKGKNNIFQGLLGCSGTLDDNRFYYRKKVLATSMRSDLAAIIARMIPKADIENKIVLDPFCGVGTLLIENYIANQPKHSIGVDIYDKAIDGARYNLIRIDSEEMEESFTYIKKDMHDFKPSNCVDVILTELPIVSQARDSRYISTLYNRFLNKAIEWLNKDGKIFVVVRNDDIFRNAVKAFENIKVKKDIIDERKGYYLYSLKII